MTEWFKSVGNDLVFFARRVPAFFPWCEEAESRRIEGAFLLAGLITCFAAVWIVSHYSHGFDIEVIPVPVADDRTLSPELHTPVREEPRRFRARTHLPHKPERFASGAINQGSFFPRYDLVDVYDDRVWWESEHDIDDTEDDHVMHRSVEIPFRRLVELVSSAGGTLKVQDAYRAEGIHAPRSLHKEGRALDLTCDELGLEKLAKLCWAAGFDWVYYEAPKRGGAHVHVSVQASH